LIVAQAPSTDVFLAPVVWANSSFTIGTPVNISNNPGYDNQPSFLPDSSAVLFASNRDGQQNDIYRYDIASKQLTQLTRTPENEYSPLVAPDGQSFICVHGAEQSLFRYDLDGGNPRLAYQHGTALIGYHVWTSPTEVAAFVLGGEGKPNTLQVIDTTTGRSVTIAENIGRSLLKRVGHATVSFVSKAGAAWEIKEFDIRTRAVTTLAPTLPRVEDLTWLPDGEIMMGSGSKLYVWQIGATEWREVADLAAAGVTGITRIAMSRDGKSLAIVGAGAR
jgi:Tol biopolymer transport system component